MRIILGVTGSIAAKLTQKLYKELNKSHEVKIVATDNSIPMFSPLGKWCSRLPIERERFHKISHIDLSKWADVLLVAPITANTIGKIAHGLGDNLLTNIALAWGGIKPMVLAPAMNPMMWNNSIVQGNLNIIEDNFNAHVMLPVEKKLPCGDTGVGAMCHIDDIVECIRYII